MLQSGAPSDPNGPLFTLLPSSVTGIGFTNTLTETPERNVFRYRNFYNGGGAAVGDLSGDGLPEVVLTSNQKGAALYLNRGEFRFQDVTRAARLRSAEGSWTTGVTLADVDGDGRLDIYLCRAGPVPKADRANQLWLNEGPGDDSVPHFREVAAEYGVADQGWSTHAAFLDYDGDGDLDLFVLNNSPRPASSFGLKNTRDVRDTTGGGHRLYRNDGRRFTDVTEAAGIHSPEMAFGLGVVAADVNRDGRPDLYVGNDFFERDYLYVNRGDGTFADVLDTSMPVISYFSMGLDIADVDNDGWPDIYTTDMLPRDEYRLKTTALFESWEVYQAKVKNDYHHQLMRNMLQRNNGDGSFTDIGQMAGVARTDWSWSALIADFDLDGLKDIFVTNGLVKDITSQDYVAFLAKEETMKAVTNNGRSRADFEMLAKAMTSTPLENHAFRNMDGARFEPAERAWGLGTPGFSNGAAYGDLDGDGALDLVVNNVNQEAFVYRNNARVTAPANGTLRVRLLGEPPNRFGVGARVVVHAGSRTFTQEQMPARGFQSSVDYVLVFGLGAVETVDSILVDWPDGRRSVHTGVKANSTLDLAQRDATAASASPTAQSPSRSTAQSVLSTSAGLSFVHRENEFVDFDREQLIPKMLSMEGPAMAVGDVNRDGLDDVYIGGAKHQVGQLMVQQPGGRFVARPQPAFDADAISEDVGAVFLDADGNGTADLYVVSGGNEFSDGAPALQDRLYLNDGRGNFRKAEDRLPAEFVSGSRVAAADYDADGDMDLFVGGRSVPWRYGLAAPSMVLRNDGRGRFSDATAQVAPALATIGMVTDGAWTDVDGDRRIDLVVVGEWMPVTVLRNMGNGRLDPQTVRGLEKSAGWWNRVVARDMTGDGRVDLVLGNLGLNSRYTASPDRPATLHVNDFDRNGFVDQIVSVYNDSVSYPLVLRDDLIRALPYLRTRLTSYQDYARMRVEDIFPPEERRNAIVREAHTFATSIARGNADGSFSIVPLPAEAQLAPVYGILADDVDANGTVDLLLAGNFDGFRPDVGRLGSGRGLLLSGDGRGGFTPVPAVSSGFLVPGQARDIQRVRGPGGAAFYVVARNDAGALVFERARRAVPSARR